LYNNNVKNNGITTLMMLWSYVRTKHYGC